MTEAEIGRRWLISLAYRMLGSVADAEDVVQEVLLRWHQHPDKASVLNPRGYLAQATTRLCVDRLRSARVRRERYVGPWLPDPVLDEAGLQPSADPSVELASDLSVALLLVLERLSPLERAAFILHDVFDQDWPDVAAALDRSETACRQLASRARTRIRDERPRYRATSDDRDRILQAFGAAIMTGDLAALSSILAKDVVFVSDGGGVVKAALKPVHGRDRVARLMLGLMAKAAAAGDTPAVTPAMLNGLPALLVRSASRPLQTVSLDLDDASTIRAIYLVANPEKLRHLS